MKFLVAIALLFTSCAAANDRCGKEPRRSVKAFFAGGESSRDVVATVASITPMDIGGFRYEMNDGARLTWIAEAPIAGVRVDGRYRFVVDYKPGFPDASSLLVYEGNRLLFAAVTDLPTRVPGFVITTGEPACRSRGRTQCHDALVNVPVSVNGTQLFHGESARVGEFDVEVLVAQKVTYRAQCADAGLPSLSLVMRRF